MTNQQNELQSQYDAYKERIAHWESERDGIQGHIDSTNAAFIKDFSPIKLGDAVFSLWVSPERRTPEDQRFKVTHIRLLQLWENGEPVFQAVGLIFLKSGKPGMRRFGIRYTPSQAHGYQIKEQS